MGARFGSAGIMPLAWTYLALLDDADLREVSLSAIASANYLSRRLADSSARMTTAHTPIAREIRRTTRMSRAVTVTSAPHRTRTVTSRPPA